MYGAPQRVAALAEDLVAHWENRRERMLKFIEAPGKAMIVGGTREICANLYSAIVALRPEWHSDDLSKGMIKVVYSGDATDVPPVSTHVRRDSLNAQVKERLKDVDDELELVIVKDMMLTGFDSPPLHTLYLDRPLKGALLMQTLARVNRTFRGKEDGLLVAYAPLAENLSKALSEYTQSDQANKPVGKNIDEAVGLTISLVGTLRSLLAGHDWKSVLMKGGSKAFLNAVTGAVSYLRNPATPGNQPQTGKSHSPRNTANSPVSCPVRGRFAPDRRPLQSCAQRSRSTRKSGFGWRSTTPPIGRQAANRCQRKSSACWETSLLTPRPPAKSWTSTMLPACPSRRWMT